jgi:hypothetical protein
MCLIINKIRFEDYLVLNLHKCKYDPRGVMTKISDLDQLLLAHIGSIYTIVRIYTCRTIFRIPCGLFLGFRASILKMSELIGQILAIDKKRLSLV